MSATRSLTERVVFDVGIDAVRTIYPTGIAGGGAIGTAQVNASVAATGVSSSGAVGSPSTTASITATGIAASDGIGSPTAFSSVGPEGIAGSGGSGSPSTTTTITVSGIASAGDAGTPSLTATITVDGVQVTVTPGDVTVISQVFPPAIAGTGAAGLPQVNTEVRAIRIDPTGSLGDPTAFTVIRPDGINAGTGGFGTASLSPVMSPNGIAGSEQFGDADTIATVFIVPGPFDPTNDFGNPVATKYGWIFRTPRNTYQWRVPPYKEYEGISLLKEDGVWVEVAHPDLERTLTAQKYLAGGRDHVVSDSLKADLVAAGYSVTTEIVTTEDYKS